MKTSRHLLLDWTEQGRIAPDKLPQAISLAGTLPSAHDWQRFFDLLLLWLGTLLVASGVIFFFAYNWNDLSRYAKFGLAEGLVLIALSLIWRLGLEGLAGKASLLAAALLTGALLALIGQIYQTGADSFELFTAWAVLILPWVLLGRFAALWLLWLALANLAAILYYRTFGGIFGGLLLELAFGPERLLWTLFIFNSIALAIWESLAALGVAWLRGRWAVRLLATASGGLITALAAYAIIDGHREDFMALPIWLAWLGCAHYVYRRRMLDAYILAGGVLSVIVVASIFLGKHMLSSHADAGAFLFIGLTVIALSAAGGWWLKQVLNGEQT